MLSLASCCCWVSVGGDCVGTGSDALVFLPASSFFFSLSFAAAFPDEDVALLDAADCCVCVPFKVTVNRWTFAVLLVPLGGLNTSRPSVSLLQNSPLTSSPLFIFIGPDKWPAPPFNPP